MSGLENHVLLTLPAVQVARHVFVCRLFFLASHGGKSFVACRGVGLSYQHVWLVRRMIVQYVASVCNQKVVSICPPSCHNTGRYCSHQRLARGVSTSLPGGVRRLEVGSVNACNLTMRAADKWESARFKAWFWSEMGWWSGKPVWLDEQGLGLLLAGSWFRSMGIFSSRPRAANAGR